VAPFVPRPPAPSASSRQPPTAHRSRPSPAARAHRPPLAPIARAHRSSLAPIAHRSRPSLAPIARCSRSSPIARAHRPSLAPIARAQRPSLALSAHTSSIRGGGARAPTCLVLGLRKARLRKKRACAREAHTESLGDVATQAACRLRFSTIRPRRLRPSDRRQSSNRLHPSQS
jgi:hypothetical protein